MIDILSHAPPDDPARSGSFPTTDKKNAFNACLEERMARICGMDRQKHPRATRPIRSGCGHA